MWVNSTHATLFAERGILQSRAGLGPLAPSLHRWKIDLGRDIELGKPVGFDARQSEGEGGHAPAVVSADLHDGIANACVAVGVAVARA